MQNQLSVAKVALQESWKTPAGSDGEGGTMQIRAGADAHLKLGDQVGSRKKLNPIFVEWLMGLPLPGWTDFAPVGTEWFRWWRLMHSELLRTVWEIQGDLHH